VYGLHRRLWGCIQDSESPETAGTLQGKAGYGATNVLQYVATQTGHACFVGRNLKLHTQAHDGRPAQRNANGFTGLRIKRVKNPIGGGVGKLKKTGFSVKESNTRCGVNLCFSATTSHVYFADKKAAGLPLTTSNLGRFIRIFASIQTMAELFAVRVTRNCRQQVDRLSRR
jgi:hypothetical protein